MLIFFSSQKYSDGKLAVQQSIEGLNSGMYFIRLLLLIVLLLHVKVFWAQQQIPDTSFSYTSKKTLYNKGKGPLVLIDEGHHNFHTKDGRYTAFAKVTSNDGYRVAAHKGSFSEQSLKGAKILVVSNAIHGRNEDKEDRENWINPIQQAFNSEEVEQVVRWVSDGGALFFVADHMPFPAAAEELATALGVTFYNGFASENRSGDFPGKKKELDIFRLSDGTLTTHPITAGRNRSEAIPFVSTFTGQAFDIPQQAISLMTFNNDYDVLLPDTAWVFHSATKKISAKGLSQGAIFKLGKGRVAVFGEAAMFSAQLKGNQHFPFGMNSPDAPHNPQFLLNVIHWLDGKLD